MPLAAQRQKHRGCQAQEQQLLDSFILTLWKAGTFAGGVPAAERGVMLWCLSSSRGGLVAAAMVDCPSLAVAAQKQHMKQLHRTAASHVCRCPCRWSSHQEKEWALQQQRQLVLD